LDLLGFECLMHTSVALVLMTMLHLAALSVCKLVTGE
jgi:hypothetical protein